ncbi:hypothetical protein B0H12DRAFT_1078389 [Mycena haematopus]|nr:hypothetical protein B0H12DRAFT_1078389 [Mycena haematopus]
MAREVNRDKVSERILKTTKTEKNEKYVRRSVTRCVRWKWDIDENAYAAGNRFDYRDGTESRRPPHPISPYAPPARTAAIRHARMIDLRRVDAQMRTGSEVHRTHTHKEGAAKRVTKRGSPGARRHADAHGEGEGGIDDEVGFMLVDGRHSEEEGVRSTSTESWAAGEDVEGKSGGSSSDAVDGGKEGLQSAAWWGPTQYEGGGDARVAMLRDDSAVFERTDNSESGPCGIESAVADAGLRARVLRAEIGKCGCGRRCTQASRNRSVIVGEEDVQTSYEKVMRRDARQNGRTVAFAGNAYGHQRRCRSSRGNETGWTPGTSRTSNGGSRSKDRDAPATKDERHPASIRPSALIVRREVQSGPGRREGVTVVYVAENGDAFATGTTTARALACKKGDVGSYCAPDKEDVGGCRRRCGTTLAVKSAVLVVNAILAQDRSPAEKWVAVYMIH